MSDDTATQVLDGNALGGMLAELFGADVTAWTARCAGCARSGPIARLVVHLSAMGAVGRCPDCEQVVLRVARLGQRVGLDLRGAALVYAPAS